MIRTLAYADFTKDMAETLQTDFAAYESEGVVRVEITDHGLWLCHPQACTRQFLGSASVLRPLTADRPRIGTGNIPFIFAG